MGEFDPLKGIQARLSLHVESMGAEIRNFVLRAICHVWLAWKREEDNAKEATDAD